MANKRVSELAAITAAELNPQDLLLVAHLFPSPESKKLTLADFTTYLLAGGNLSGSFYGTASWSQTASYALNAPLQTSASYALVAGNALNAISATFAANAGNAATSVSSSYATIAAIALTASVGAATFASNSLYSQTASYLLYVGTPNGTASFALVSANAVTASYALNANVTGLSSSYALSASLAVDAEVADTSSYVDWDGVSNNGTVFNSVSASYTPQADYSISSSHALIADLAMTNLANVSSASYASQSLSSSYAYFASTALTASYAFVDPNVVQHGIYAAISQSLTSSQVDRVSITAQAPVTLSIQSVGSLIVPWTSSVATSESVNLNVINRTTGVTYTLDNFQVFIFNGGASASSGSIKIPYTLIGSQAVNPDHYMLQVQASSQNFSIFQGRPVRFVVDINIGSFAVSTGHPLVFYTDYQDPITFSSSLGGPFTDYASNMIISGSNTIQMMDMSNVNGSAHYAWTLHSCSLVQANNAFSLNDIGGMPNSLVTMSISSASINLLQDLSNTNLKLMTCTFTNLPSLPLLPTSMSYININGNVLQNISSLPAGLTQFYCDNSFVTSLSSLVFPNTIVSMSLSSETFLNALPSSLPTSLVYFWCRDNPNLTAFSSCPPNLLYLDVSNNNLSAIEEDGICADLQGNGLLNGYLNLQGNTPITSPSTFTRITTLLSRGWTVLYS